MKVTIDADRCQGQGRCFGIAPEIFDFDDIGNGIVKGDGNFSDDLRAQAELARDNCPEHAITVE
jgi:ferredoxin